MLLVIATIAYMLVVLNVRQIAESGTANRITQDTANLKLPFGVNISKPNAAALLEKIPKKRQNTDQYEKTGADSLNKTHYVKPSYDSIITDSRSNVFTTPVPSPQNKRWQYEVLNNLCQPLRFKSPA